MILANEIGRGEQPSPPLSSEDDQRSLTSLRRFLTENSTARILIGGKRHNFDGRVPGLMEEALLGFQAAQPLFLAGGFGGVAQDIVQALDVDDGSWLPPVVGAQADDQPWFRECQSL